MNSIIEHRLDQELYNSGRREQIKEILEGMMVRARYSQRIPGSIPDTFKAFDNWLDSPEAFNHELP